MSAKSFAVSFGGLCDDLEIQLNRQGLTLGSHAELMNRDAHEIARLRIRGLLTEVESGKARNRLFKEIGKHVKPVESQS